MEKECILISVVISIVVTLATNKVTAAYTFKVIDGYVKDMIEIAKKSIRDAYSDK